MIYLDFEKEIKEIDSKIAETSEKDTSDNKIKTERNEKKLEKLYSKKTEALTKIYKNLSAWDKVQVARHPDRPHTIDYINGMIDNFIELSGDRSFANDNAIIGGIGYINDIPIMVIGEEKGNTTETRLLHNFGMPKPEGYRKAVRLLNLASKFNLPVITFVDTAGAFPGIDAEERGQSEAIASSIKACFDLNTPSIAIVIGEGGSGGAIAIAVANTIMMLENSVYSVISPEGCASILWRSQDYKKEATKALKMTANNLLELKIIDKIIGEGIGGAHRNKETVIQNVKSAIIKELNSLQKHDSKAKEKRYEKFLKMTRL